MRIRKKQQLNICVDIDGTVTDPYYWLGHANHFFGKNIATEDVKDYEMHKVMGVAPEEISVFYDQHAADMHAKAEVRPGAAEVLRKFHGSHKIHFVTARQQDMEKVSIDWLRRNHFPMDSIHHLGTHHKVATAKALGSHLFIEDSLENARELAQAGLWVLLLDCSYNQATLPRNVTRVRNWHQISDIISMCEPQAVRNGFQWPKAQLVPAIWNLIIS